MSTTKKVLGGMFLVLAVVVITFLTAMISIGVIHANAAETISIFDEESERAEVEETVPFTDELMDVTYYSYESMGKTIIYTYEKVIEDGKVHIITGMRVLD